MVSRRLIAALLCLTWLTGCGASAPTTPPTTIPATALPFTSQPPTSRPATPVPATLVPAATAVPATLVPTATAVPATATPVPQPTSAPTSAPAASQGEELLFLRGGTLWAADLAQANERRIVDGVIDFAVGPGATQLALLRGAGKAGEIWLVDRTGANLRQLTRNDRSEASLNWSPDGAALIYGSSAADAVFIPEWWPWAEWCLRAEVRVLDLATATETSLAKGCQPAVSPDGRRIAYSAPPTTADTGSVNTEPTTINSLRLINRKGENGWDFAKATGVSDDPLTGRVVYAPAWSPNGEELSYQRFVGYWALVDVNLSEIGASFQGKGQLYAVAGGWMLPARYAPNGRYVAVLSNDPGNARGLTGYGTWQVELLDMTGKRSIALPSGELPARGESLSLLPGGQQVAWAPDSSALAVQLPPNWSPSVAPEDLADGPGAIWIWKPGQGTPTRPVVENVQFASPLAWLPASK